MRQGAWLIVLATMLLVLSSCAGNGAGAVAPEKATKQPVEISIAAAASLKSSFDEIIANFEAQHAHIRVSQISYDGSSTLATQIIEGSPVDVFASADEHNWASVRDAGLSVESQIFASNTLRIAVPRDNPGQVESVVDLARVTSVLCAPQVPCGALSQKLLESVNVHLQPASLEQNVAAVLRKVAAGEADAGLVYRTDVLGDDRVEGIAIPGAEDLRNRYPISVIDNSRASTEQREAAGAFVDYVLSTQGQRVLADHGFGSAK